MNVQQMTASALVEIKRDPMFDRVAQELPGIEHALRSTYQAFFTEVWSQLLAQQHCQHDTRDGS